MPHDSWSDKHFFDHGDDDPRGEEGSSRRWHDSRRQGEAEWSQKDQRLHGQQAERWGQYAEQEGAGEYAQVEKWEPKTVEEWIERDPFREYGVKVVPPRRKVKGLQQVFGMWRHLPNRQRRQFWREREIAASLYDLARVWKDAPEISSTGVGLEHQGGRSRLVGVVKLASKGLVDLKQMRNRYGIPHQFKVPTRVTRWELADEQGSVPIRIEYSSHPRPQGIGEIPVGQWVFSSGGGVATVDAPVLQSGGVVAGEDVAGLRSLGTLSAIVSRENDVTPLLLSAAHVFGAVGRKIIASQPTPSQVGDVIQIDQNLDAALARIIEPWVVDYRLRELDVVPAAPVVPVLNMPVQFVGGASGHQMGWINRVNDIRPGGNAAGLIPNYVASNLSQRGDSGALLITSHYNEEPFTPEAARSMHPYYRESMTCAMLGILIAGPSENIAATTRAETYFMPIVNILNAFDIKVWVRPV